MVQLKALVSGASGFIGSNLVRKLGQLGYSVQTISNTDLYLPTFLKEQVLYFNPNEIYHLASYGNMHNHTDCDMIVDANIMTTYNLLEACKNMSYSKFVYVSSSSVTLPNATLYSACKKAAEALTEAYRDISIVRPYSVTGVGEQESHLIPILIDAAYKGKTVPFVPKPTHDFIDVEDVVAAMIKISTPGIYSLGASFSWSNQEVLGLVEKITNKKVEIKEVDHLRSYDTVGWRSPDNWSNKSLYRSIEEMAKAYDKK